MDYIEIKNLNVGYGSKTVVGQISFNIAKGDYICVVGQNGSGKSTFLNTFLGLIPKLTGDIIYNAPITQKDVGYLSQRSNIQKDFPASVLEVVKSGRLNRMGRRPFYNKSDKEAAQSALKTMDIVDLSSKCFNSLSGGQQQRVLLARAMCAANKVIFLDEPASGLDPQSIRDFYKTLANLKNSDISIVMVTHDIEEIAKEANKFILFKDGEAHELNQEQYHKYLHNCRICNSEISRAI